MQSTHRGWLGTFESAQVALPVLRHAVAAKNTKEVETTLERLTSFIRRGHELQEVLLAIPVSMEAFDSVSQLLEIQELTEAIQTRIDQLKLAIQECFRKKEEDGGSDTATDSGPDIRGGPPYTPVPLNKPRAPLQGAVRLPVPTEPVPDTRRRVTFEEPAPELVEAPASKAA